MFTIRAFSSTSRAHEKPIAYSPTPCLKRNCTVENDFNQHLANTKECFFLHGYPEKMVK